MGIASQIMFAGVTLHSITAAISGCIYKEEQEGIDEYLTPSLTSFQSDSTVLHVPKSSETFQFRGHNMITTSYLSPPPHLVQVTLEGGTEAIEIKRSTKCPGNHCGYYATKDDIDYSIKPVFWRYSEEGERIWSFDT